MGRLNDKVASASKWAVHNINKRAATDLDYTSIRVSTVFPGMMRAPMFDSDSAEMLAHFEAMIRLGRISRPKEVAQFVALQASDARSYSTGAQIVISGGAIL